MATAKPKYSAAAFRRLLAKLAAAKAEARPAIEAQIKEIYELASPGFGDRFIDLFRKGGSPERTPISIFSSKIAYSRGSSITLQ